MALLHVKLELCGTIIARKSRLGQTKGGIQGGIPSTCQPKPRPRTSVAIVKDSTRPLKESQLQIAVLNSRSRPRLRSPENRTMAVLMQGNP